MGRDKASLPFDGESMLARTTRLVRQTVNAVVIVQSPNQTLPSDVPPVTVAVDRRHGVGPLEGLAAGWQQLGEHIQAVFVCGCDSPLLRPAVVQRLFDLLNGHDAVVPRVDNRAHPLTAVYAHGVGTQIEACLAADERAIHALLAKLDIRWIAPDELRDVDPQLESLLNVNRPEAYHQALKLAGATQP